MGDEDAATKMALQHAELAMMEHEAVSFRAESRCALGWPAPGNGYWTEETLAATLRRYPGLDATPYREAIPRL